MSGKIVIVDYGMGNLRSVQKKVIRLKGSPVVSSDPKVITNADKLILPGVGHFQKAMENLHRLHLTDLIHELVLERQKPILGICLGMQVMAQKSEEGNATGLGWIDAEIVRFKIEDSLRYKVPHMGWNQVSTVKESPLMQGIDDSSEFYFVHAYHLVAHDPSIVLNETDYEYRFASAVQKDHIFGVQYHPEKSHESGDVLMNNFLKI